MLRKNSADEEDSGQESRDGENQGGEGEGPLLVRQVAAEKKKEKKRRPVKVLRVEDYIEKTSGLRLLYEEVKKKKEKICKKGEVNPEKALQDYMLMVKEWSFNLAPKYEFDYFMDRTQALGKKKEVVSEMQALREYHKGRLVYNAASKQYEEPREGGGRQMLVVDDIEEREPPKDEPPAANPPRVYEGFEGYESVIQDEDRQLMERLIDQEDLDYKIKKVVKTREEEEEEGGQVLLKDPKNAMDEELLPLRSGNGSN